MLNDPQYPTEELMTDLWQRVESTYENIEEFTVTKELFMEITMPWMTKLLHKLKKRRPSGGHNKETILIELNRNKFSTDVVQEQYKDLLNTLIFDLAKVNQKLKLIPGGATVMSYCRNWWIPPVASILQDNLYSVAKNAIKIAVKSGRDYFFNEKLGQQRVQQLLFSDEPSEGQQKARVFSEESKKIAIMVNLLMAEQLKNTWSAYLISPLSVETIDSTIHDLFNHLLERKELNEHLFFYIIQAAIKRIEKAKDNYETTEPLWVND